MTAQPNQPPLRLGLVLDSTVQPRWIRRCLEKVLDSDAAKLALIFKVDPTNSDKSSLLLKLYDSIDRTLFPADAMEAVNVEDLLAGVAIAEGLEGVNAANLDVLINFGPADLNPTLAHAARHGVWFYIFGDPPGFQEMADGSPTMVSELRSRKGDTEQLIYRSVTPVLSKFSIRQNNNTCYWKSAAFVLRSLEDLRLGRHAEKRHDNSPSSFSRSTKAAMPQLFLKLSGRSASRAFEKLSSSEQWMLAYRIRNGEFKYLVPPSDEFWADPFPLKVNGRSYVFFEDYVNSAGRAHISVIEVDQQGIVSGPTEALKLDCHLSYPFVFQWQNVCYMIPESGERNVVELYRAVSFPFEWEPVKVLIEANSPLDATVIEVDGTWWMFVNIQEEGVAVNWDELHLYYAESLFGPWKPHARNPIVSDVRSARPAGRLFWSNNILYRPGQDSSLRYGYATTISKVTKLSRSEYDETEVLKIIPDWDNNIVGTHTLNFVDDITVIDCLAKRSRFHNLKLRAPKGSLDRLSSANIEAFLNVTQIPPVN